MVNPVVVEVGRGGIAESRHRGAYAVFDADDACVMSAGDVDQPVFPRSAVKAIQALPLVESGAAERFSFGDRELALACASHSGEAEHRALALSMLESAGLNETALECGPQWPDKRAVLLDFARDHEEPTQLCNNCSGKHAGFLCTAVHEGVAPEGYVGRDHAVQKAVRDAMESVTGAAHGVAPCGFDGCSIPTYAIPLAAAARGFARIVSGAGLEPVRAVAARRLLDACMAEPFYVAGTRRACTEIMQAIPGRIFVKTGAEGVYCGALPDQGLGFALKIDDGATRAAETLCAGLVSHLMGEEGAADPVLARYRSRPIKTRKGVEVGRMTAALAN